MNKSELLENYTAEQLADKYLNLNDRFNVKLHEEVEKFQAYNAKIQKEIKERKVEIEKLKKENDELKTENAELHCEMQAMMIFPDEFPKEPIKVADMLIDNAMGAYNSYVEDFAKAYAGQLVIGNPCEDVRRQTISYLRQIAEHLLVYCNHNESENE